LNIVSGIVGSGPCACPNGGNHRGIATTKEGRFMIRPNLVLVKTTQIVGKKEVCNTKEDFLMIGLYLYRKLIYRRT
jgi:hypothetical protein